MAKIHMRSFRLDNDFYDIILNTETDNTQCIKNSNEIILTFTHHSYVHVGDMGRMIGKIYLKDSGWCYGEDWDSAVFYDADLYETERLVSIDYIMGSNK